MPIPESAWKTVHGTTYNDAYGWRIQYAIDRTVAEEEKKAVYKAGEIVADAMLKADTDAEPATHEHAQKDRDALLACFGGSTIYVEEIPNGYCSRGCCAFFPWFIVTTSVGRIKIGWRKSVIHLEWTDSAVKADAKEIFPKEEAWPGYETTQYDKIIHAHSYVAAAAYIGRIFNAHKLEV